MWGLIGTIIGASVSLGAVIFVEYLRRPKLHLKIEDPPHDMRTKPSLNRPVKDVRFLWVKLLNRALPWYLQWMLRAPALQCRAAITFHHYPDRIDIFGKPMDGRWSSTATTNGPQLPVTVYPGESELLDIAIRADEDDECYGYNDRAAVSHDWRNPEWKLDRALYWVRVTITSSGQKYIRWLILKNSAGRSAFRLQAEQPK